MLRARSALLGCLCSGRAQPSRVSYAPGALSLAYRPLLVLQMSLAGMVSAYTPPAVYVKHVCFVNFTQ